MPKITIDGKEIEAREGQSVIEVAHQNGISIGHYCWHPGLSPEGNCRMCLVEVEKAPKLMPSCMTQVAEGMVVRTEHASQKVRDAQKDVMEFLLVDHPIDCPICDQAGECKLQDYYMKYDKQPSHVPLETKIKKEKRVHFSDQVTYDTERCILCTRCVRFCREVGGQEELGMFNRGAVSFIGLQSGELQSPYQGNIVDICPVGALTNTDFRFRKRVWFMSSSKSLCAGCSRGCNILTDYDKEEVFRYRPRENPDVNKWWMCDEGRLSYKHIHAEGRALVPLLRQGGEAAEKTGWDKAFSRTAEIFQLLHKRHGTEAIAAIGSPLASLEENYLLKKLFNDCFPGSPVSFPSEKLYHQGQGDKFLITADKSPNALAGSLLGLSSLDTVFDGIESGKIKALYVLGDDFLKDRPGAPKVAERAEKLFPKLSWLICQTPYLHKTTRLAHAVFAGSVHAETTGTFVNVDRRAQRFFQAIRPPAQAREGIKILRDFGTLLGAELPNAENPAVLFDSMAAQEKSLGGLSWNALGDRGMPLPSQGAQK